MSKLIVAFAVIVMLSGCAGNKPRDVVVVTDKIDVCDKPPQADKIVMRNVDFKVIQDKFGIYWVAVTPKFYENLSVNMQEIIQHIKQQNAVIKYYESCHKGKTKEEK